MRDFKYKIRASKSLDLVTSCSRKVRNKLEWEFDTSSKDYSEALIKIAIEIFNKVAFGYEPPKVITFDLDNGKRFERDAIEYYDKSFGTEYLPAYLKSRDNPAPFEKSNGFATGSRDFGDDIKTIDCKTSTCKNVFDAKRFLPLENKYIAQLNTYNLLYGTSEIELYNFLAPKSFLEIEQAVYNERKFNYDRDDAYFDSLQEKMEQMYAYDVFDGYGVNERTHRSEVPEIANWEETLYLSVEKMNRFITEKLEK